MKDFADRVNLGLIPSSEEGWPIACAALKNSTGGWLHIHVNVSTYTRPEGNCVAMSDGKKGGERRRKFGGESNPWEMEEKQEPSGSCDLPIGRFLCCCQVSVNSLMTVTHHLMLQTLPYV